MEAANEMDALMTRLRCALSDARLAVARSYTLSAQTSQLISASMQAESERYTGRRPRPRRARAHGEPPNKKRVDHGERRIAGTARAPLGQRAWDVARIGR